MKYRVLKAQANALFAKSGEELAKQLTASQEDNSGFLGKAKTGLLDAFGTPAAGAAAFLESQESGTKEIVDKSKANGKALNDAAVNISEQILRLQHAYDITDPTKDDKNRK